jgi:hypothetical protein
MNLRDESNYYVLKNDCLEVRIAPNEGGRIASLRSNSSKVEFLAQPYQESHPESPSFSASFEQGFCAGIEECLPSVGPCNSSTSGGAVPDHGDFWQLPWNVTHHSSENLRYFAMGFSRTIRFEKDIALVGNSLNIRYRVQNVGDEDVSLLYACHPLLAIEPGDRVCLPADCSSMTVNYTHNGRLGKSGDRVSWPLASDGSDLSIVQPHESHFADMLYSNRLHQGWCGLFRTVCQQGIQLHFNRAALPFLGVWLCYGGWPHPPHAPLQYAVALEPTFAPVNTLETAQRLGLARVVEAKGEIEWSLRFEVGEPNTSLEKFWPNTTAP